MRGMLIAIVIALAVVAFIAAGTAFYFWSTTGDATGIGSLKPMTILSVS